MKWEVFVHGTPQGQKIVPQEDAFVKACYKQDDSDYLLIEQQFGQGVGYCYYHYLVYSNVQDCSGRPGGYVGITLRSDVASQSVKAIYACLDAAYRLIVRPRLLESQGDWLRFRSPEVDTAVQQEVERFCGNYIATLFERMSETIVPSNNKLYPVNLSESEQANVLALLQQGAKLKVSSAIPSMAQQGAIMQERERAKQQVEAAEAKCEEQHHKAQQINAELQQKQTTIQTRDVEIERLKQEKALLEKQLRDGNMKKRYEETLQKFRPVMQEFITKTQPVLQALGRDCGVQPTVVSPATAGASTQQPPGGVSKQELLKYLIIVVVIVALIAAGAVWAAVHFAVPASIPEQPTPSVEMTPPMPSNADEGITIQYHERLEVESSQPEDDSEDADDLDDNRKPTPNEETSQSREKEKSSPSTKDDSAKPKAKKEAGKTAI